MSKQPLGRPVCSPTVEKLLLEIEGQPVRAHARKQFPQETRNYTKENIKRLKEIQAICRQKDNSPRNPMRALPSSEFPVSSCPSRPVSASKQKRPSEPYLTTVALVPSTKRPLALTGNHPSTTTTRTSTTTSKITSALPRSNSETSLNGAAGLQISGTQSPKPLVRSPSASELIPARKPVLKTSLPHELGSVPKYLQARKLQWKLDEEEKRKKKEEIPVPAGHTLLSEEERLETLELLKKTQDEILQKMATLPLHFATLRARQQKEELDKQLEKTEEGLKIFSRPRVLIKHGFSLM